MNDDELCPSCMSSRLFGCKFGCPRKQPPSVGSPRSYEHWAEEQKKEHAKRCEKCMRPWAAHACPSEAAV